MAGIFSSLKELLQEWQLRALVLFSLTLQLTLIILGNRRKYTNNFWIKTMVWLAYLTADSVPTAALGILARNMFEIAGSIDAKTELTGFWAPFLLLHLGGPDTITAYSLEDTELWSRHFLQLVLQTGFAFYVFIMAWTGSRLSILSIPMMFVGLIKYGERTWVLWLASYEQRRVSTSKPINIPYEQVRSSVSRGEFLETAYGLLEMTKRFFADVALAKHVLKESSNIFGAISRSNAFKVIEMELGFMYDILYTKAMVIHTLWGIGLRFISFLLTSIVLGLFTTTVAHDDKYSKSKVDTCITFLLLSMAILLELYAALVLLCSDRTLVWLRKHNMTKTSDMGLLVPLGNRRSWLNTMGQYSLLSYFLKEKPMGYRRFLLSYLSRSCRRIPNISKMYENLEKQEYEAFQKVPEGLKEFTFTFFQRELRNFFLTNFDQSFNNLRCESMGRMSLNYHYFDTSFCTFDKTSVFEMEFEQIIIIWHIATELCYHLDIDLFPTQQHETNDNNGRAETDNNEAPQSIHKIAEMSNYISRYMMYLLVMSPDMLPGGGALGETYFRSTCNDKFAMERVNGEREREACEILYNFFRDLPLATDLVENLWYHACKMVEGLRKVEASEEEEEAKVMQRWIAIRGVWMELLGYASIQCRRSQHGQQLRQGGEFLTHVALFMTLVDYAQPHTECVSASSYVPGVTMDSMSPATEAVCRESQPAPEPRQGEEFLSHHVTFVIVDHSNVHTAPVSAMDNRSDRVTYDGVEEEQVTFDEGQKKWAFKPRGLNIKWGSSHWRIHKESNTNEAAEAAELEGVTWLEVTGSTKESLTRGKKYEIYFTISMGRRANFSDWNECPVFVMAKIGKEGRYRWTKIYLSHHYGKRNVIIPANKLQIEVPAAGNNNSDPDTRLYFGLYEVWTTYGKSGLIIHNAQVQEVER